jgi:hypothetical protein
MTSRSVRAPALLAAIVLAGGCADYSPAPLATGLEYRDPAPRGWRLVRDPSSTPTRLVLAVVGPAQLMTRGVGFNLRAPAAVRFRSFESSGFPVEDTGAYELLNVDPCHGEPPESCRDPQEPVLLAGGVKAGNVLTAGVFQKDRRATAKASGVPLARIALELDPAAGLHPGAMLALEVLKAKYSPEDIGAFSPDPTQEQAEKGHGVHFTLAVGELRAR